MNKKFLYEPRIPRTERFVNYLKFGATLAVGAIGMHFGSIFMDGLEYGTFNRQKQKEVVKRHCYEARLVELADKLGDNSGEISIMKEAQYIMWACDKKELMSIKKPYTLEEMEKGIGRLVTEVEKKEGLH